MKKYVLTIKYNASEEDIESIEERLDECVPDIALPDDTTLIHKCISPFYEKNPNNYDELMSVGVDNGFVIGDA